MAFVDVPGGFIYPRFDTQQFVSSSNAGSYALDAASEEIAFVIVAPKTGTLDTIWFLQKAQTTIEDLHISFQNLDSSNEPDNTADQYRVYTPTAPDIGVYVSPGLITDDGTDTGVKRSVTQGDRIAVVIKFNSAIGDIDIITGIHRGTSHEYGPFVMFTGDSGTTWGRPTLQWRIPAMMLEYETDGIVAVDGTWPVEETRNTTTIDTASTPDELGLKFQVPFKCKVSGIQSGGPASDATLSLENAGGSVLGTAATPLMDPDTSPNNPRLTWFEHAAVELDADTNYYIVWSPTHPTTTRSMYSYNLTDASHRAGLAWGVTSSYNERTDGGAWSEDTTKTMLMALMISAVDDGAGGGGGSCALANGTAVIPATCPV